MDDFELQLNSLPFGSCSAGCEDSKVSEIIFTDIWPLVNYGETELVAGEHLVETESGAEVKCHETVKIPEEEIKKTDSTKTLNCARVSPGENKTTREFVKEFRREGKDSRPDFETDEIGCLNELRCKETELTTAIKLDKVQLMKESTTSRQEPTFKAQVQQLECSAEAKIIEVTCITAANVDKPENTTQIKETNLSEGKQEGKEVIQEKPQSPPKMFNNNKEGQEEAKENGTGDGQKEKKKRPLSSSIRAIQERLLNNSPIEPTLDKRKFKTENTKLTLDKSVSTKGKPGDTTGKPDTTKMKTTGSDDKSESSIHKPIVTIGSSFCNNNVLQQNHKMKQHICGVEPPDEKETLEGPATLRKTVRDENTNLKIPSQELGVANQNPEFKLNKTDIALHRPESPKKLNEDNRKDHETSQHTMEVSNQISGIKQKFSKSSLGDFSAEENNPEGEKEQLEGLNQHSEIKTMSVMQGKQDTEIFLDESEVHQKCSKANQKIIDAPQHRIEGSQEKEGKVKQTQLLEKPVFIEKILDDQIDLNNPKAIHINPNVLNEQIEDKLTGQKTPKHKLEATQKLHQAFNDTLNIKSEETETFDDKYKFETKNFEIATCDHKLIKAEATHKHPEIKLNSSHLTLETQPIGPSVHELEAAKENPEVSYMKPETEILQSLASLETPPIIPESIPTSVQELEAEKENREVNCLKPETEILKSSASLETPQINSEIVSTSVQELQAVQEKQEVSHMKPETGNKKLVDALETPPFNQESIPNSVQELEVVQESLKVSTMKPETDILKSLNSSKTPPNQARIPTSIQELESLQEHPEVIHMKPETEILKSRGSIEIPPTNPESIPTSVRELESVQNISEVTHMKPETVIMKSLDSIETQPNQKNIPTSVQELKAVKENPHFSHMKPETEILKSLASQEKNPDNQTVCAPIEKEEDTTELVYKNSKDMLETSFDEPTALKDKEVEKKASKGNYQNQSWAQESQTFWHKSFEYTTDKQTISQDKCDVTQESTHANKLEAIDNSDIARIEKVSTTFSEMEKITETNFVTKEAFQEMEVGGIEDPGQLGLTPEEAMNDQDSKTTSYETNQETSLPISKKEVTKVSKVDSVQSHVVKETKVPTFLSPTPCVEEDGKRKKKKKRSDRTSKEIENYVCTLCKISLPPLTPQHTCRGCKQVFCTGCTSKAELFARTLGKELAARVCDPCFEEYSKTKQKMASNENKVVLDASDTKTVDSKSRDPSAEFGELHNTANDSEGTKEKSEGTEINIKITPKNYESNENHVEDLEKCTSDKQKSNEKAIIHYRQKKLPRRSCEGKDFDDIIARPIQTEYGSKDSTKDDSKEIVHRRKQKKDKSENVCSTDDLNVDYTKRSIDKSLPEKDIRRRSTGETSQKKLRRRSQKNAKKKLHDEHQDSVEPGMDKTKALHEPIEIEESITPQGSIETIEDIKEINDPVKSSTKKTKALKKENKAKQVNTQVSNEKSEIRKAEVETQESKSVATSLPIQNTQEIEANNEFEIEKELEKQSKDYETESAKIISESIQEGQVIDLKPCHQNPNIIQELYLTHGETLDPLQKSEQPNKEVDDTHKIAEDTHKNLKSPHITSAVTQDKNENIKDKFENKHETNEALKINLEAKPKRMTLPIIYKNKSAQEMYQRKTFSVKVSEEKMNLRRQEKIKSPTPEPIINQQNIEIDTNGTTTEMTCDTHEMNRTVSKESNNDVKEVKQDIENSKKSTDILVEKAELSKENNKEILEEDYITEEQEANEEFTEDNYIKAVCEKRSQIKILENVAQGIANSKSKQIENIKEQTKNVDEETKCLEKEMNDIDRERKKLIERQEQILQKCKENKGKILKLNENQMKIEEERNIQLMSNKGEMSVQQQKLLVLITMKPVAMNVANEKVFIPKLTLLDIYNRRIEAKEKEVECPMCFVPATTPIYMCEDHHLICSGCIHKVTSCPKCNKSYSVGEGRRNRNADVAAKELVALVKERDEVASGSRNGANCDDSSDTTSETSHVEQTAECPNEATEEQSLTEAVATEADKVVATSKTQETEGDVDIKSENRVNLKPEIWNIKVPQGIPPHIAKSAFELYKGELRGMSDKAFKDFLKDWSSNSPMYLYLKELRLNDPALTTEVNNVIASPETQHLEVDRKLENRKSWNPDKWNIKVPQGIPPHIAESAFELYNGELRSMSDKVFREFLRDWSPDSPMYLYLKELRLKVR